MSVEGGVGICIPRIVRVNTIWDELLFKLRVSFDGLAIRKKILLESSYHIETHLGVVVEFIAVQISVAFEFCLDEELIEFGDMISFLRFHMPKVFVGYPP